MTTPFPGTEADPTPQHLKAQIAIPDQRITAWARDCRAKVLEGDLPTVAAPVGMMQGER